MIIEGLPIPKKLLQLIREGRWYPPEKEMFTIRFGIRATNSSFYNIDQIENETRAVNKLIDEEGYSDFLGSTDSNGYPGRIEAKSFIIIADTSVDCPICLYYKNNENPMVIYNVENENGELSWMKLANNFEEFLVAIY